MKFEEAIVHLKNGKKIRRHFGEFIFGFNNSICLFQDKTSTDKKFSDYQFTNTDIFADDWEVIHE